jgi:hypothetical protein
MVAGYTMPSTQGTRTTSSDYTATKGTKRRLLAYFYPKRNLVYQEFVDKYPPVGKPAVLRKLLVEGFDKARAEMDDWIDRLRNDEEAAFPIIEEDSAERYERRHEVFVQSTNADHRPVIDYFDYLGQAEVDLGRKQRGELKQRFVILALVRGSQVPEIEKQLRGL